MFFKVFFVSVLGIPLQHKSKVDTQIEKVLILFFSVHFFGLALSYLPQHLGMICNGENCQPTDIILPTILTCCFVLILTPFLLRFHKCEDAGNALNILCLLELGTALICISMTNFSLGLFCSVVSVPAALCVEPTANRYLI